MASKEIDRWLKTIIEQVPDKIKSFRDNKLESQMVYYTGNWQKDVLDNLTAKQSEKIFKKMHKLHDEGGLQFLQKRLKDVKIGESEYGKAETITGYQYIVMRDQKAKAKNA